MPRLIIIYGPPLSGKSTLAAELAATMDGKTALVSTDAMLHEAIRVHDADTASELAMVHTQARLLVVNFLKNGYHVVMEGAFYYDTDHELHRYDQDIDQTLALMRNIAQSPVVVRLTASEETLRRREAASPVRRDVDAALRIEAAYKPRHGTGFLRLTTDATSPADLAARVRQLLEWN